MLKADLPPYGVALASLASSSSLSFAQAARICEFLVDWVNLGAVIWQLTPVGDLLQIVTWILDQVKNAHGGGVCVPQEKKIKPLLKWALFQPWKILEWVMYAHTTPVLVVLGKRT